MEITLNQQEVIPKVKVIRPINFLFHRTEVKLSDLANQVPMAKEIFKEPVRLGLHPSSPIHWHYFGFTGDASKSFTLEIGLPVASVPPDYDGKFHFKRTEVFKCVSLLHEGSWYDIPKSYDLLMKFIQQHALQPIGANREIYINAYFVYPEANVTDIQIGISSDE